MRRSTLKDYTERILRVLVHLQRHLDDNPSLDELAAIACFSPFHFHRVFSGMVGESVRQHVRRLRLERAALHLRHGQRTVTDIAFEAGYETHESFTRAFRNSFGDSPSGYRSSAPTGVAHTDDGAIAPFTPRKLEEITMSVEVRALDPQRVVFMRHVGPYDEVGATWEQLADWAGERGLIGAESRFFGACYDDPEVTAAHQIRYDACISTNVAVEVDGKVGVQTLGGGRYAVTLHEGPYDRLNETYAALYGLWLPAQNEEPGPPPGLEFYLNEPDCTPAEDLLTEVCIPLR